jgi:hypothetical protein
MVSIQVRRAPQQLAKLSAAVNATAPEIRKELLAGIRKVGKPAIADIRAETATLPQRGGFGPGIAAAKFGVRTTTHGKRAGVRIQGRQSGHDIAGIELGLIRKPLFGNRSSWHSQPVRAGFFSRPILEQRPRMQKEIIEVVGIIRDRIHRRAT